MDVKLDSFEDLARLLMTEHKLSKDWEFRWSKNRLRVRSLASCSFMANGIFKGVGGFLSFSRTIVEHSVEEQRAAILHEIAHALVADWQPRARLKGEIESHGEDWLRIARSIRVSETHLARYM